MANEDFAIREIGAYIPETRIDNLGRIGALGYAEDALRDKIGILATARKAPGEETSDMCVRAWEDLANKLGNDVLDPSSLDLIVVVTQHPDGHGLPHTSAILHGKLGLPTKCFAFDISLGCSGFVAALATVKGFLATTGGRRAVLFTADPYSKSVSEDDKNTAMIFGDAATATLIEPGTDWKIGAFDLGTDGSSHGALERDGEGVLRMNGRAVFNFCALNVPKSVNATLEKNGVTREGIDTFVFHPGSKYIVDTISTRLQLTPPAALDCAGYGNSVSSSIPLVLAGLDRGAMRTVFVSGFGVGLGWASCILTS
jgi:3-oxoacyl-[acyl-carrier-protein] synthase-3